MRRERGQTLVMFALTMMLLTLMVCMTLSFGAKAKEKLELQTVADEAAFSNAVVTARTFNTMAVTNRAFVAEWAAMAGVESLISWVAYYRSAINAARYDYLTIAGIWFAGAFCCNPFAGCMQWCACSIKGGVDNLKNASVFSKEEMRLKTQVWPKDDPKAALQAYKLQSASSTLTLVGETPAYFWLLSKLLKQNLASGIVAKAGAGSATPGEWSAPNGGAGVAIRETFNPLGGGGALLPYVTATIRQEAIWAAMGTRSHPFVTDRTFGQPIIQIKLTSLIKPPNTVLLTSDIGSGYLHDSMNHSRWWANGAAAWGDDHSGIVTANYGMPNGTPCPWPRFMGLPAAADVYSPWAGGGGQHTWLYGSDMAPVIHEMGSSIAPKGIITNYMDYNPIPFFLGGLDKPSDLYGEPKNYAVVQRDYHARPPGAQDPWNLFFNFRFVSGSSGSNFNINDSQSAGGATGFVLTNGTDISKQTALAAGITYYHRAGHWSEPPNMFNPFWRAGLVSTDIDKQGNALQGGSDVPNTLNSVGASFATDAFNGLVGNGFKGFQ